MQLSSKKGNSKLKLFDVFLSAKLNLILKISVKFKINLDSIF